MPHMRLSVQLALLALPSILSVESARAQWAADGAPVAVISGAQSNVRIADVGSGSSVLVWDDNRPGAAGIYAQKLDASGVAQWTLNGVLLSATGSRPRVLGDGAGGAFVVWRDSRSGALGAYGQRLNSSGAGQWTAGGVRLSTTFGEPEIDYDGSGGVVAAWPGGAQPVRNIYAQRVSGAGSVMWASGGVDVCLHPGDQELPDVVGDGSGGAIVVWLDHRDATHRVYARRIGSAGDTLWTANGTAVSPGTVATFEPALAEDGVGGAYISLADQRVGGQGTHLYVHRLTNAGAVAPGWTSGGVDLGAAFGAEVDQDILRESTGDVIVAQNGGHVSHVTNAGAENWTVELLTPNQPSDVPIAVRLASDAAGGALAAWRDFRSQVGYDTYATQVLANGTLNLPCPEGGEVLSDAGGDQTEVSICSNGSGSAIAAWRDGRTDSGDIYALKMSCPATVGVEGASLASLGVRLERNPSFGSRRLLLTLPDSRPAHVTLHDVSGRIVERHTVQRNGGGPFVLEVDPGRRLASGTYFVRVTHAGRSVLEKATLLR